MFRQTVMPRGRAIACILSGLVLLATSSFPLVRPVAAATTTGNLTVQVTVTAGCSIVGSTLDFGSNNGNDLIATALTATSSLSVTCTTGSPYSIGLDNGANASGSQRRLQSSGRFINYGLFTDSAMTVPWQAGATPTTCATSSNCVTGVGNGAAQSITVYGRIPAIGSSPGTGSYTDTVVVTVTY